VRFNEPIDVLIAMAFAAYLLWPLRHQLRWQAIRKSPALEMLVLAMTFLGLYIVFPYSLGDPTYVDVRPLTLVPAFLMLACVYLADERPSLGYGQSGYAWGLGVLFVLGNLLYLANFLISDNAWIGRYRAVVAALPVDARVLPVYTLPKLTTHKFMWRCGYCNSFAVIDRDGFIPYMFSGDQGNPMKYFRYRNPRYAPAENWYLDYPRVKVNWNAVACTYDFLLVTQPFDRRRIEIPVRTIAESSSAALLAVDKRQCSDPDATRRGDT
jgi:hypothetical protein